MSAAPDARFALRVRGVLESADLGLRALVLHARAFAQIALVTCVPGLLATLAMRYIAGLEALVVWLVALAWGGFAEGPFTTLAGAVAMHRDASPREAGRVFAQRAVRYAWYRSVSMVLQAASALALLVPWLFVAPSQLFVSEVVLLERANRGVFSRAGRVVATASGRAMRSALLFVAVRVGMVLLADAALRRTVGLLFDLHAPTESLGTAGISPYALAGFWASVPVIAMMRYLAYVDLRTQCEGWDVQRRFQRLSASLGGDGG